MGWESLLYIMYTHIMLFHLTGSCPQRTKRDQMIRSVLKQCAVLIPDHLSYNNRCLCSHLSDHRLFNHILCKSTIKR